MVDGVLIAESLRVGSSLDDLRLVIRKLSRYEIPDAADHQPKIWTIIEFSSDVDPDKLAQQLAETIDEPGWYVDFHTPDHTYVVFPGKTFRYPRGDTNRRAEVADYAKAAGVPDTQIDWSE